MIWQGAAGLATFTDVLSTEEWNEETIASRAEWLCEKALELWKILLYLGD